MAGNNQGLMNELFDFRWVFDTLMKYKWVIIGSTIITAIIAFVMVNFVLPGEYIATAFVAISEPNLVANLDPSIQVEQRIPDSEGIIELSIADDLLTEVYQDPAVRDLFQEDIKISGIKGNHKAQLFGSTQLKLQVTDSDPGRAAEISNVWSRFLVERLNSLYGTNENALQNLITQSQQAKVTLDKKQAALEEYLPESRIDALEGQLSQTQDTLLSYHDKISENMVIISDALSLLNQFSNRSEEAPFRFEEILTLITLQRRSVTSVGGLQSSDLQIQVSDQVISSGNYSVGEGREKINDLVESLRAQNEDLKMKLGEIEDEISKLKAELESEKYRLDSLKGERDLAKSAYKALSGQLEEVRITIAQEDQVAKIAAQARKPDLESGPNPFTIPALVGLAGLMVSLSVVFVYEWWKMVF